MNALVTILVSVLDLYWWIIIAAAVLSWLVAFNVVNTRNQAISAVGETLYRLTEPALRPIRRILPDLGGIDLSPVVLLLLISFLRILIEDNLRPFAL